MPSQAELERMRAHTEMLADAAKRFRGYHATCIANREPTSWDVRADEEQQIADGITALLAENERLRTENERLNAGGFTASDGGQWVRKDRRDDAEAEAARLMNIAVEFKAIEIYDGWSSLNGWVPWVTGGNGNMQHEARKLARQALESPHE